MSRPPRPLFRTSTSGDGSAFAANRQFLPVEFAEMVQLERALAESESRLGVTDAEGDFAYTLMELSALVAHTLGLYQNLYAREAYLGTAETARSLVLHSRRLAYEPDQGLAASGYAVLTVGKGLKGKLPARFALATSPRGEVKAQTLETLDELDVDAARNEALPVERTRPAHMSFSDSRGSFRLEGTGLSLAVGEYGILVRDSDDTGEPVSIVSLVPDDTAGETRVEVELLRTPTTTFWDGSPTFRFLAMPKERLHRFGWNADPVRFPPANLNSLASYAAPTGTDVTTSFGYAVTLDSGDDSANYIYLSTSIKQNFLSKLVIVRLNAEIAVCRVAAQGIASVAFRRGQVLATGGVVEAQISDAVTYVELGSTINRSTVALQSPVYADWQFEASILSTEPNPDAVTARLEVDADFGDFRPGSAVAFETLDGTFSQVVEIQSLTITPNGTTEINWVELTDPPPFGWMLDNIRILGNVSRVTHGETQEEVLGGSDGVTPFQRFELKHAPLTQVPGADGGEPAIEVRVNEVAWTRVEDFFGSGPEDRHYRLEFDEDQKISVIFGNGRKGAIPPSGKKHIRAVYRRGLGVNGNAGAGAAARIKKAHPLIERASNPTPILGGADPARLNDLGRQATRSIRTFDRAVSIQDHADLALLFPGVARAGARPTGGGGIEVIVATAEGAEPPLGSVERFLNARRDTMLPMEVLGPEAVDIFLDLAIEHDPAYLTENVKRAVQDALFGDDADAPGMFTFPARNFGQAAHLSEVYDRVADVRGVAFVDVTRFRLEDLAGVFDVLQVNARQWLRLPAAHLALSIVAGASA